MTVSVLDYAIVTRPHYKHVENGDGGLVRWLDPTTVLVAVVDGLGHGPLAAEVSEATVAYLESCSPTATLPDLLRACHVRLQGTRGAALALARLDLAVGQLEYAGVGNIEARLLSAEAVRPISYNGIVGAILPRFQVFTYSFRPGALFLMHSDGVSARFTLDAATLSGQPSDLIATSIMRDWSRPHDDATMVVVRHTGNGS